MTQTTRRPLIGITAYTEPVTRGEWVDQESALVPSPYVRQVERAGGIALLIPPRLDADPAMMGELLDRLDGLILSGGADVDPSRYAAVPHPSVQAARPDRDNVEILLAQVSAERDLAVLGICRGMQVMAVEAGGTLEQNVPDRVGTTEHAPATGRYAAHPVRPMAGTRIGALLGADELDVPTYHHQSVLSHPGYLPAAWHEDGTLEAMEDPLASFRLAVQWHPEQGEDPRLFEALIAAATAAAARR